MRPNGPDALPTPANVAFAEQLYADFLRDAASVPAEWQTYFEQLTNGDRRRAGLPGGPSFRARSIFNPAGNGHDSASPDAEASDAAVDTRQDRVDQMVRAYRVRGHALAQLDPLCINRQTTVEHPELEPGYYGFTPADLDRSFSSRTIAGANVRSLREIVTLLRNTYCRYIGVQFMHIDDLEIRHWLQERMEGSENRLKLARREQLRILTRLTDAVMFEEFIARKFLGKKSFSLEGAETLIPLLDLVIEKAGEHGIDEIVMGMAHRGRLNVLANILGKHPRQIFREFKDLDGKARRGGDVKYHLGFQSDWTTASGQTVHLAMCFNPSHLEFVNPVVVGRMRAKMDRFNNTARDRGMALLIHGDAAFAGEGIVQETLNLSGLPGYTTGGTLHVIVNNQVGFTTDPAEGRSTPYCTDVAKMLQSPIFHVNGEVPEAVAQVVKLAMDFRRQFKRDVFIDMYCYRRRGHNETDEPAFTQPRMYDVIGKRKSVREAYLEHLMELGGVTREEGDAIAASLRERLEQELSAIHEPAPRPQPKTEVGRFWRGFVGGLEANVPEVATTVPREQLAQLLEALTAVPPHFNVHPKVRQNVLERRRQMARGELPLDWGAAEALALASLATQGTRVRLSGQDAGRGTFSHRHAILTDVASGQRRLPLQHLAPDQAPVEIINSPLSEAGVMGFEYGYSLAYPDALVMWEAQFGDFVNAAQVIIDQFITSAEEKWHWLSGLVLLLPHGYEGQGPEHSSARLERFLELAAEDNIQVCYPSTPAQHFHLLRRQALRPWRKPLIVMTPKSLLRKEAASSTLDDLAAGAFQRVIPDSGVSPASAAADGDDGRPARTGEHGRPARATSADRDQPAPAHTGPRGRHTPSQAGEHGRPARATELNDGNGARATSATAAHRNASRILLCSGKVYYDLAEHREKTARDDVAIVRIEQLYPLTEQHIAPALRPHADAAPAVWVQEEPQNMGAWRYLLMRFGSTLCGRPLSCVSRRPSASPATGSEEAHKAEQAALIADAFG